MNYQITEHQTFELAATPCESNGLPAKKDVVLFDPGRFGSALLRLANRRSEPLTEPNPAAKDNLTESTPDSKNSRSDSERRAFPRRESGCDVRVHCLVMGAAVSPQQAEWLLHATSLRGSLVNLSMNGIAFLLDQPLESASQMLLRMTSRTTDLSVDASVTVVQSTQQESGDWKTVGRFDRNLTLEQVHELGRHLSPSTIV